MRSKRRHNDDDVTRDAALCAWFVEKEKVQNTESVGGREMSHGIYKFINIIDGSDDDDAFFETRWPPVAARRDVDEGDTEGNGQRGVVCILRIEGRSEMGGRHWRSHSCRHLIAGVNKRDSKHGHGRT